MSSQESAPKKTSRKSIGKGKKGKKLVELSDSETSSGRSTPELKGKKSQKRTSDSESATSVLDIKIDSPVPKEKKRKLTKSKAKPFTIIKELTVEELDQIKSDRSSPDLKSELNNNFISKLEREVLEGFNLKIEIPDSNLELSEHQGPSSTSSMGSYTDEQWSPGSGEGVNCETQTECAKHKL